MSRPALTCPLWRRAGVRGQARRLSPGRVREVTGSESNSPAAAATPGSESTGARPPALSARGGSVSFYLRKTLQPNKAPAQREAGRQGRWRRGQRRTSPPRVSSVSPGGSGPGHKGARPFVAGGQTPWLLPGRANPFEGRQVRLLQDPDASDSLPIPPKHGDRDGRTSGGPRGRGLGRGSIEVLPIYLPPGSGLNRGPQLPA